MERLIRSAVNNRDTSEVKKLSNTVHHLQVQNELLRHENNGLQAALMIKKRRKKQSKPLAFKQKDKYHGGAVFYSPSKIKDAGAQVAA